MNVDWYTKLVLTVISVCLVILVLRNVPVIPEAHAVSVKDSEENVTKVEIVGISHSLYRCWEPLPVKIGQ